MLTLVQREMEIAPDPIFEAILSHKIAHQAHENAVAMFSVLDEARLPEACKTEAAKGRIITKEDARWIAANKKVDTASNAVDAAAYAILKVTPATLDGVVVLLTYATKYVEDGNCWPEDGIGWACRMQRHIADAIAAIAQSGKVVELRR